MTVDTFANMVMAESAALDDKLTDDNAFVAIADISVMFLRSKRFHFSSVTNDLQVQILGSVDNGSTFPEVVEASFDVLPGTLTTKVITGIYSALRIEVRPKVAATHGTLSTLWMGSTA